ncbi:Protein of unknown function [Ruminococcaceae bacterium YRB3002]|nr:Protein of unknown function [Ruminococcaceae bacterium YRB3002]
MKKILAILLVTVCAASFLCACSSKTDESTPSVEVISSDVVVDEDPVDETEEMTPEKFQEVHPEEIRIRSICELASMRVYFHNVAKAVKPAATGIMGIGQSDRRFWVEYDGEATIGIDMSQVSMTMTDNVVTVRMPHARFLGEINVDASSYSINSIVVEPEGMTLNPNKIEADDVTTSIREANIYAMSTIMNNRTIMIGAEHRTEALITNYIKQLSKMSGENYQVEFEYID